MIVNRDIIIVGQQPWDIEIGSNCKNIAMEMSKHNRVLYVNSPLDRITLFKQKNKPNIQKRLKIIRGQANGLVKLQDNLWNYYPDRIIESINWIKVEFIYNWFKTLNNRRLAASIQKAIKELGFKDFILFNDNDMFRCFYMQELLKPVLSIYYIRDYMLAVNYWKLHGTKLEPILIKKSDLCLANSTYLTEYAKKYNDKSFYVGQGCELDVFIGYDHKKPAPADIAALSKPIIGYIGALQSIRLDIELVKHLAVQKPEWSIVLVGPEDDGFKESDLHQLKNVHFLGAKTPGMMPGYIAAFDVCINPQLVNQVTIGNYPRKIDEYLAMGKPVVATHTYAMSVFEKYVYLCVTKDDYIAAIEKALKENSPEKQQQRIEFASSHTWENSVKEIYDAIDTVL